MIGKKRHNGFEYPRSVNQIVVAAIYTWTFASQALFIAVCAYGNWKIGLIVVHGALGLAILLLWTYCTYVDPECLVTDKPIPICTNLLGQRVERTNLFCSICCKRVYGMDHHCVFLNNCIGSRNYCQFILLLVFSLCHMIYNTSLTMAYEVESDFAIK
jgi:palmitoyltransferase